MYWESLKNAHADEPSTSWRTDEDASGISRVIALEHQMDRAGAQGHGTATAEPSVVGARGSG